LTSEAQGILRNQARWLSQYSQYTVTIEGHADERGTREYNIALGARRAQAVKNVLVALGIPAGRIQTISYGKERPAVVGSDEAAWAQNRRDVTAIN
jgi:peptidoglycan-associated lipoprotein